MPRTVEICVEFRPYGGCIRYETRPSDRTDIRCTEGTVNCTPIDC